LVCHFIKWLLAPGIFRVENGGCDNLPGSFRKALIIHTKFDAGIEESFTKGKLRTPKNNLTLQNRLYKGLMCHNSIQELACNVNDIFGRSLN